MDANALHNEIMRIIIGGKAFEDQPFRFMRLGGGYKICSLNDGRALTLSEGSAGLESFSEVSIQKTIDKNQANNTESWKY